MSRRWIAAPAAALLLVAGVTAATGAPAPAPVTVPDDAVVVAGLSEGTPVTGIEVAPRVITWGTEIGGLVRSEPIDEGVGALEEPEPEFGGKVFGRAYTPDLGQDPLALGATVVPPISDAISATSNDRWAIGFDPYVMDIDGYGLWVKPAGGPAELMSIPPSFGPNRSSVALSGNTALVGTVLINLATRDVIALNPQEEDCLDPAGAALADGVLLINDLCAETVVAVDVPASGLTMADLDGARTVAEGYAEHLAYSRGLMVWLAYDEAAEVPVVRWQRIDQSIGDHQEIVLPYSPLSLRVHGERFVVMVERGNALVAQVYDAGAPGEPVALVPMDGGLLRSPDVEGLAQAQGLTGSVGLDYLPVDLFGRTLAWTYEGVIYALTLPVLSGGSVAMDAPAGATAGDTITVSGSGFAPWEEVAVWLNSDAELLGLGYAGADGSVSVSVTIPADMAGSHTLSLFGVESGWDVGSALAVQGVNPGLEVQTG